MSSDLNRATSRLSIPAEKADPRSPGPKHQLHLRHVGQVVDRKETLHIEFAPGLLPGFSAGATSAVSPVSVKPAGKVQ